MVFASNASIMHIFLGILLPKKFVFITLAFKHLYLYINR